MIGTKLLSTLSKFVRPSIVIRNMSSPSANGFNHLAIDETAGIVLIGINRPEKRNAVNHETAQELFSALKQFEDDPQTYSAVLYGKGGNFCAGYDLSSLASINEQSLNNTDFDSGIAPMGPSRMFIKKPVIAAIEGYCVAGGLELSLLCDMRIADEGSIFGVYCRRFGVPLIDGGTVRLQKLIGLSRAMDMIITGRSVKAKEAAEIGLVNKVVPHGTAVGAAVTIANELKKFPQKCLNADRRSAYHAAYNATSIDEALRYEYENGIKVLKEESVPGAKKFTEGMGKHGSFNMVTPDKPKL